MGFAASIAGKRLPITCVDKNLFFNSCSDLFHEQSIAQTESESLASCLESNVGENGFNIRAFLYIYLTDCASLNFTSLAAVHLEGSSCFNMNTKTFIRRSNYLFLNYIEREVGYYILLFFLQKNLHLNEEHNMILFEQNHIPA